MPKRTNGWPRVRYANAADEYQVISNNVTNQVIGSGSGNQGDYLHGLTIMVANASNCAVSLRDGAGAAIPIFPNSPGGGIGTYYIPLCITAVNNWNISLPAGASALASGLFTQ